MITKKDVLHVAKLSKLEFTEEETEQLVTDLSAVVGYVNTLQQVDTSDVTDKPSYIAFDDLREDLVKPSLPQSEAIKNAPKKRNGGFSVPQVVE